MSSTHPDADNFLQSIKRSIPGARTNGPFYRAVVATAATTRKNWRAFELAMLKRFFHLPELSLEELVAEVPPPVEPIRDHMCMPPYAGFGHDDFGPLMAVARALNPSVIVELGTAHGNTVANLARHCPEAQFYTVNAPAETMTGELTTYSLDSTAIGTVYRQYGYTDRVTQIYANTLELDLSKHLGSRKAQLAIVDACHDAFYVENDFRKVVPFLDKNGLILLHDNHPSMEGHLCGSYLAAMRLRRRGYDIRQLRDCWWGVYRPSWAGRLGAISGSRPK